eukprot:12408241-Karenia_brevis.AAC.1
MRRFEAWGEGDFHALVRWWRKDCSAAHRKLQRRHSQARDAYDTAHRAVRLIAEGDVSRALKGLTSLGLGDATDERVVEQLAAKHPQRKEDLPSTLEGFAPFTRLHVDLGSTLRHLDPRSGTGASGCRNSYLRAL